MTREDAIQFLTDTGISPEHIMELVEALSSSEKPNKWIPVSEGEYPEAYTEVLVYDNSDYFIAWWTGIRGHWDSYNSQFDINTPIVAWMPIEPYKASSTGAERSDKE